jgi:hypothetical protein
MSAAASHDAAHPEALTPPLPPKSGVPEWVKGTKECQRQLIPGVCIYSDQGKVFLSLSDPRPVSPSESRNKVVFEVPPESLLGSEEEELRNLELSIKVVSCAISLRERGHAHCRASPQ